MFFYLTHIVVKFTYHEAIFPFIVIRIFHFPYKKFTSQKAERLSKRIIWFVVMLTFFPSLYFGYDLVQQNRFTQRASRFINLEAQIPGDYLLSRKINGKEKSILLVYGGNEISKEQAEALRKRLPVYGLSGASLEIRQGFASFSSQHVGQDEKLSALTNALQEKQQELDSFRAVVLQRAAYDTFGRRLFNEINIQYPGLRTCAIAPFREQADSGKVQQSLLVLLSFNRTISKADRAQIRNWLVARTEDASVQLNIKP